MSTCQSRFVMFPTLSQPSITMQSEMLSSQTLFVVIDPSVENYQALVDGIVEGANVFVLDADRDGIEQITHLLRRDAQLSTPLSRSLHIISHGAPGTLYLGNSELSLHTLHRYAEELQQWNVSNLSLYGCNVAAGDAGEDFVETLHRLTRASISASRQTIGNGYWLLDYSASTSSSAPFAPAVLATWTGTLAISISNLSNSSYTEQGAAFVLDSDVTFSGGTNYNNGYIEFSLSAATSSDYLTITPDGSASTVNGQVSIVGGVVYLGDGTVAQEVGSIDATLNGQNGKNLRINFATGFQNGNFNIGTNGSTTITGWTGVNQQVRFGTDTIAGLATPVDTVMPSNAPNGDGNIPGIPGSMSTTLSNVQNDGLGNSVRLTSIGIDTAQPYDVVRGPYIYSNSTVNLLVGDTVSFEWQAQGGDDAYDVYGYIVDVNNGHIETILNETGGSTSASTTWATKTINVTQAGEYRFVFVAGTYDFSGGQAAGAQLYIDDVKVTQSNPPQTITDSQLAGIAQRVKYNNTSDAPPASQTLTLSAMNFAKETASSTATINITAVDDPTTIGGTITGTGTPGNPITGTLTATDADGLLDGTIFSIQQGNGPTKGTASIDPASGAWIYTSNTTGTDSFTVTVTDDQGSTATQVINVTVPDTVAPVLQSAAINGTSLVLTYDEALDSASLPGGSAFTIMVNGAAIAANQVAISGSKVTLTLPSAVKDTDTVFIAYTPGSKPIQDVAGNDGAALTGRTVTNNTLTPPSPPILPTNPNDPGSGDGGGVTNNPTPALNGKDAKPGTTIALFSGDQKIGEATVKEDGTWIVTPTTALPDGTYQVTVKAIDKSGNASDASLPFPLTIDTKGALGAAIDLEQPIRDYGVEGIAIQFTEKVFNFDVTDVKLTLDGQPVDLSGATLTSIDGINWVLGNIPGFAQASGNYQIDLSTGDITDVAGNGLVETKGTEWLTGYTSDPAKKIDFKGGKKGLRQKDGGQSNLLIGSNDNDQVSGGGGNDTLRGLKGHDKVGGGGGKDKMAGNGGNDRLRGQGQNDTLLGNRNSDVLAGGKGNDRMNGGGGDDVLYGGLGRDKMLGGKGADVFQYRSMAEQGDRIRKFEADKDLIDVRGIFSQQQFGADNRFAQFHHYIQVVQVGSTAEVRVDVDGSGAGQDFVTLTRLLNTSAATITSKNFVVGNP